MEYARIAEGMVAEMFTPPAGVALAECFTPAVAVQFVVVPSGVNPAPGWSYSGGTFTAPPAPPPPTPAQLAQSFLNAGTCAIASASMPAVNGTYAIDPASRATMGEIVLGIQAGDGLPGGGAGFIYDDALGPHTFAASGTITAATQFQAVAVGIRNAIYAATQTIQNRTTVVPAQPWPIP